MGFKSRTLWKITSVLQVEQVTYCIVNLVIVPSRNSNHRQFTRSFLHYLDSEYAVLIVALSLV